jgi:carboxylate-amine ligase
MMPRTGIPHSFSSWGEYKRFETTLNKAGAFGKKDTQAKIWWDIRPHPIFDTLEFRITDICTRVEECVCIAALFQAINQTAPQQYVLASIPPYAYYGE